MNIDNFYRVAGVPKRYRYVKAIPPFKTMHAHVEGAVRRISDKQQEKWMTKVIEKPLIYPYLMGISSSPTDAVAMEVAMNLFSKTLLQNPSNKIQFINVGHVKTFSKLFDTEGEKRSSMVVLHNILEDSTTGRVQMTRDLITLFDETFVIVVVGTSDITAFFNRKIKHPVDTVLNF